MKRKDWFYKICGRGHRPSATLISHDMLDNCCYNITYPLIHEISASMLSIKTPVEVAELLASTLKQRRLARNWSREELANR